MGENLEVSNEADNDKAFRTKAALFLAGVSGMSAIVGFGATLAAAKRQDPQYFGKGMTPTIHLQETGASLALRALGWGSLYAVTGCGLFFYGVWKLSGAQNFAEFRYKIGNVLPRISSDKPPVGRTEFTGLNDLLNYLQHQKGDKDRK